MAAVAFPFTETFVSFIRVGGEVVDVLPSLIAIFTSLMRDVGCSSLATPVSFVRVGGGIVENPTDVRR